eukprot:m.37752 g.37752  ORF g.37752 m.37752 type:complete len:112 (+) comp9346_c0_seq2:78-413(+)
MVDPTTYQKIQQIDNQGLKTLLDGGDAVVLDVRTPMEMHTLGVIPGAKLLPIQELMTRLEELDKNQPTAVICEHGVRSVFAASFLVDQGFQTVYNHTEGMHRWNGERVQPD